MNTTMTKKNWKREMELRNALALARVSDIAISDAYSVLDTFRRAERSLQRLAEHSCNGYPKEVTEYRDGKMYRYNVEDIKWRTRCEKREALTENRIKKLAGEHKLTVEFQGDPRGLMFRLYAEGHQEISLG
jgi:hypothetical protein